MKSLIIVIPYFISNLIYSQYIKGLSATQHTDNQIKTNLKVYLPTYSEFRSTTTSINQNIITLSTCYFMTDLGAVSNLENDFYINIPNNGNYTLIVKLYTSFNPTTCNYENLEDTVTLNFVAPIEGTVSLSTNERNNVKEDIRLFPIPTKDLLNIETEAKIRKINIYDSSGKLIQKKNENKSKINTSDLKNGVYYIEIIADKKRWDKKFIIQR